MLKEFSIRSSKSLRQKGFQAYLVGGCVRDLLLGREPKDYDVATDATPEQIMESFPKPMRWVRSSVSCSCRRRRKTKVSASAKVSPKSQCRRGRHFSQRYRILRRPTSGRSAFQRDPREDVARRDFTINGMLLDPVSGEVLDFVGGRKDLEAGIIRTIGDPEQRFGEDKLRMLRAVRFAARFEYAIEPGTFSAIQKLAEQIRVVSRERVRDELTRMLTEGHARRGVSPAG